MSNARATTLCARCGAWLGPKDTFCEICGTPVSRGDPFAGIAPPPPPPIDRAKPALQRSLPKVFVIAATVAVAAALAFVGVMEYGTHANLADTKNALTSARGELSGTRTTLHTTRTQLNDVVTTLDGAQSQLAAAQAQIQQLQQQVAGQQNTISGQQNTISGQQNTITGQKGTIASQGAEIADLNTCLKGVSTALLDINYYGNVQAGIDELNSVNGVCTRAENNLPPG